MSEQWVCTELYRTFRGYVFWQGNPVTVTDKGTMEAIRHEKSFKRYEGELDKAQKETAPEAVGKTCSKCGKSFARGLYIHEKYCKG